MQWLSATMSRSISERLRRGLGNDAFIVVSDIHKLHKELVGRNVNIIEGPVKRVYGSTEVIINDCNGFKIAFTD